MDAETIFSFSFLIKQEIEATSKRKRAWLIKHIFAWLYHLAMKCGAGYC